MRKITEKKILYEKKVSVFFLVAREMHFYRLAARSATQIIYSLIGIGERVSSNFFSFL